MNKWIIGLVIVASLGVLGIAAYTSQKITIEKNEQQALLDACYKDFFTAYEDEWNAACEKQGKGDRCRLEMFGAKDHFAYDLKAKAQTKKNECDKLYK